MCRPCTPRPPASATRSLAGSQIAKNSVDRAASALSSIEELYNFVLRFGGTLPTGVVPVGHTPSSDVSEPGRLGQVVSLMEHLDTYVRGDGGSAAVRRDAVVGSAALPTISVRAC